MNSVKQPSFLSEGIRFFDNRYTFFLLSIILLVLIEPLLSSVTEPAFPFTGVIFSAVIVTIFWTLRLKTIPFVLFVFLAVATLAVDIWHFFYVYGLMKAEIPYLQLIVASAYCVLIFAAILALAVNLFKTSEVTADTIRGGFAVYFLLGFLWSLFFQICLLKNPASIYFPEGSYTFSTLLYFSFTTLTTLGYGDIVPVASMVRNLAILEAVFGQIFLASFIARLIGLHIKR